MKRIVSLCLAVGLMCLLVACRKAEKEGDVSSSSVVASVESVAGPENSTASADTGTSVSKTDVSSNKPASTTKSPGSKVAVTSSKATKPATTLSKPATSSKPAVQSKPATPSQPKPAETAKDWIIGKWNATIDVTSALAEEGIPVMEPLVVKAIMEFTADFRMITVIDENSFRAVLHRAMQSAVESELAGTDMPGMDQYIQDMVNGIMEGVRDYLRDTGTYKFVNDTLWVKDSTEPDFVQVQYRFTDKNNFSLTSAPGEVIYLRRA